MPYEYDVLIVDDDPIQANVLQEALEAFGFSTRILSDGSGVVSEVRRALPRLVIMDIIMPGADGLAICMKLKPVMRAYGGNVVIASGKDRSREEPRARKAGAAAFLQKPFRIAALRAEIDKLLGAPYANPPRAAIEVGVKVWGGRGPGGPPPAGSAFGTLGPSVSFGLASGEVVLLDGGTGIRPCSEALLASNVESATLLLTHYHPAHLEGLPGLGLLAKPGFKLRVMGPADPEADLADLCRGLNAQATLAPFLIEEKEYRLSDAVTLGVAYANHPSTTLAFSLQASGRKIVYCPDADLPAEGEVDPGNNLDRMRRFAQGADLLILDAHFAPEDLEAGRGEGHSSWRAAVRLAREAGARKLWLFHVSGRYSDPQVAALESAAKASLAAAGCSIGCEVARDGLSFQI